MNFKKILLIFTLLLMVPVFINSLDVKEPESAVIFMYHRFGEDTIPSTNITIEQFAYQLDYLKKNNYNVVPLSTIINLIKNKSPIPPKTVALTIDDAYISTYEKAYPMLKKKNFPFTVFVSTNPVDNNSKFYMSWDMMREMQENGADFANHSLGHEFLLPQNGEADEDWKKRVSKEIENAQKRLQEELGEDTNENPKVFSYPFGEYNKNMKKLLQNLGYTGITQTSGPVGNKSDLMALTRFPMAEAYATPEGFNTKLNTLQMPIKSVSPNLHVIKENPPKLKINLERELDNIRCYTSDGEEISVKRNSSTDIEVSSGIPLNPPRDKYTCTAPADDGRWYWYSHLWIIK